MGSFIVKAEDFVTQAQVSGQRGQLSVDGGTQGFPSGSYIEVIYDRETGNGELTAGTSITGVNVYSSYGDYLSGTTLYTYGGGGSSANIGNGPFAMGDTFLNVDASSLTSGDAGAPTLGRIFLSPGSDVTSRIGSYSVPRRVDLDLDGDGRIIGIPENANGNYFAGYSNFAYICFGSGTAILTPDGMRAVDTLAVGDRVVTRDNGAQPIRWVGRRHLTGGSDWSPQHRPILIRAGALGGGLPERDLTVSPNHRVLLTGARAQTLFAETEVLAAAKHLLHLPGIERREVMEVTYHHFLFDRHEIVLSEGAWTESFQPGAVGLGVVDQAARDEILALFPDLAGASTLPRQTARPVLRRHEARLVA